MYQSDSWMMVLGVALSLVLIGGLVWYVNSVIPKALDERQWLTRFVALVLTVFLGVFVADLVVSWDVQLLSNELRVGHWFKRLMAIDILLGNADHQVRRFGELVSTH